MPASRSKKRKKHGKWFRTTIVGGDNRYTLQVTDVEGQPCPRNDGGVLVLKGV